MLSTEREPVMSSGIALSSGREARTMTTLGNEVNTIYFMISMSGFGVLGILYLVAFLNRD